MSRCWFNSSELNPIQLRHHYHHAELCRNKQEQKLKCPSAFQFRNKKLPISIFKIWVYVSKIPPPFVLLLKMQVLSVDPENEGLSRALNSVFIGVLVWALVAYV